MAPPKLPEQIVAAGLRFRIYKLGDGRLAFDHKADGTRKVVKRRTLEQLKAAADAIAFSIVNAETAARDLTAEDRRVFIAARDTLAPFGATVDGIAREAAEAFAITGRISLSELARFYVSRNPGLTPAPPTVEILAAMLTKLAAKKRSEIYLRDLKRDLTPFATQFPDLTAVHSAELHGYLDQLGKSSRRRDNIRDAIARLFSFARDQKHLPQDRKTEAEGIEYLDEGISEVTTYTPAELKLLLKNVEEYWRPWFLIGAFAGMRTSEIFRLEWKHINFEQRTISVNRRVAKKIRVSRKVPIPDNLLAWLEPYRERIGPLYPNDKAHGMGPKWRSLETRQSRALGRLTAACGLAWEKNALRHSFGSHRLAIIQDEPKLALEMGTSVARIRENYNEPKAEAEAAEYFAIRPDDHDSKILHLPLKFA